MEARCRDAVERRFINPLESVITQLDDVDAMTYVFADLFHDALCELKRLPKAKEDMREIVGVVDGYARKYGRFLNSLECRMGIRALLKGKTIHNVFPVEGYYGEVLAKTGTEAS